MWQLDVGVSFGRQDAGGKNPRVLTASVSPCKAQDTVKNVVAAVNSLGMLMGTTEVSFLTDWHHNFSLHDRFEPG